MLAATCALAAAIASESGPRADGKPAPARSSLHVPFERYRLPNGLTVILHEDHRLPQVVVDVLFRVGSKDERPRRTGFAHLFEHLMFMGTQNVPNGRFDQLMEAWGGQNNAATSEDRTNYFEMGPSHLLETFLWLEADRLATLPDAMTKDKVDLQRDVVKNERRQSYENRPYGRVELALPEHLYPDGHPYHHPVIGSHADLTAASVDDVKAFFRSYYVASNASLVVAGDFKPDEARRLIERWFGWMVRVPEPEHAAPKPTRLEHAERVVLRDAVELEQVTLAWSSPEDGGTGDAECELLAALLGLGKSSRLQRALVYEQKLAQEVIVEQRASRYGGTLVIVATAQPGHSAQELERAIDAELSRLRTSAPPTEREVERARALTETKKLEEVSALVMLADQLNEMEFRYGDPGLLEYSLVGRYQSVSAGELLAQARALFGQPRLTVTVLPAAAEKK
jgi:predicted Zn-dependent peptidase